MNTAKINEETLLLETNQSSVQKADGTYSHWTTENFTAKINDGAVTTASLQMMLLQV